MSCSDAWKGRFLTYTCTTHNYYLSVRMLSGTRSIKLLVSKILIHAETFHESQLARIVDGSMTLIL